MAVSVATDEVGQTLEDHLDSEEKAVMAFYKVRNV